MISRDSHEWIEISDYAEKWREKFINQLIIHDDEQARGSIKFIDRLLALPDKQAGATAAAKEQYNDDGTGY